MGCGRFVRNDRQSCGARRFRDDSYQVRTRPRQSFVPEVSLKGGAAPGAARSGAAGVGPPRRPVSTHDTPPAGSRRGSARGSPPCRRSAPPAPEVRGGDGAPEGTATCLRFTYPRRRADGPRTDRRHGVGAYRWTAEDGRVAGRVAAPPSGARRPRLTSGIAAATRAICRGATLRGHLPGAAR